MLTRTPSKARCGFVRPRAALLSVALLAMVITGCDEFVFPISDSYVGAIVGDCRPLDGCSRAHHGWDAGGNRQSVYAMQAGTVIKVINNCVSNPSGCGGGGAGNQIQIRHNNGYYTKYFHLYDAKVGVGETVTRGQYIAESGGTGGVAPHLHFELYDSDWGRHHWYRHIIYAGNDRYPERTYNNDIWTPIKTMHDGVQARLININDIIPRGSSWSAKEIINWDPTP